MTDEEKLLNLVKDCIDFKGNDLFHASLLNSIEDFVIYKKQLEEKEKTLQKMRDEIIELERVNVPTGFVGEPSISYCKALSLYDIVEYAEGLESNDDVKTIQIMLFSLFAKDCEPEELEMISNIRPKRRPEVINNFYGNSQNIREIKKQINNHGRDNNK